VEAGRCVLHRVAARRMTIEAPRQLLERLVGLGHGSYGTDMRALVACFGNLLRGDDGFGPAIAARLLEGGVPDGVRVLDAGIGGIHVVHELHEATEVLVVVDAATRGLTPGTVFVMRPDVVDVLALSPTDQRDQLADVHYATPERALMLASALGLLPDETWLIGCEPLDADRVGEGLSAPVTAALDAAVAEVHRVLDDCGWAGISGEGRARPR